MGCTMVNHFAKLPWHASSCGLVSIIGVLIIAMPVRAAHHGDFGSVQWQTYPNKSYWQIATNDVALVKHFMANSGEAARLTDIFAERLPDYRFALLHGLPENLKLSAGLQIGRAWLLSKSDIEGAQILLPEKFQGRLTLQFLAFVEAGKAPIHTVVIDLQVKPEDNDNTTSDNANIHAAPALGAHQNAASSELRVPRPPQLSSGLEDALLGRANELRRQGDIAGARLLYEKLAELGSQKGALYMAQSFDAQFLKDSPLPDSIKANSIKALEWYEIAKKLGSEQADERLNTISSIK